MQALKLTVLELFVAQPAVTSVISAGDDSAETFSVCVPKANNPASAKVIAAIAVNNAIDSFWVFVFPPDLRFLSDKSLPFRDYRREKARTRLNFNVVGAVYGTHALFRYRN